MIRRVIRRATKHQSRYYKDRVFRRVKEKKLAAVLETLGVAEGQILYIQSSFGSLGYYPNGINRFIELLKQMLGADGTIVMPCFPFGGSMQDYVAQRPTYDARHSQSKIGMLPEAVRVLPNARRSCHPTHPVVALGGEADWIIAGHENCDSPQGDNSPFDKLVRRNALVLRINTPAFPLCHRLQEIINWPNLFLDVPVKLDCIDDAGRERQVTTRVYRKKIPFVMYLPGTTEGGPVATNIIDFPLLFESREDEYAGKSNNPSALNLLLEYRRLFESDGTRRRAVYNGCPIDAFPADRTMTFAVSKAQEFIRQYRASYDLATMTEAMEAGRLSV
jgi:aminoglycoside 3-N-acetyltransferase